MPDPVPPPKEWQTWNPVSKANKAYYYSQMQMPMRMQNRNVVNCRRMHTGCINTETDTNKQYHHVLDKTRECARNQATTGMIQKHITWNSASKENHTIIHRCKWLCRCKTFL
jgi:hypothetical protein